MTEQQGTQAISLTVSFDHEPTEDDMIRVKRSIDFSMIRSRVPASMVRYEGPTKAGDEWIVTASGVPVERPRTPDEAGFGARG